MKIWVAPKDNLKRVEFQEVDGTEYLKNRDAWIANMQLVLAKDGKVLLGALREVGECERL